LVGVVTPSSAETSAVIDDKARIAVTAAPATSKHLFFMEASIGYARTTVGG